MADSKPTTEEEIPENKLSVLFCLPQRYLMAVMLMLGITTTYMTRASFSLILTEMVKPQDSSVKINTCFPNISLSAVTTVKDTSSLYNWDVRTQSLLMGGFYYGYLFTQIPSGILAERWNAKHTFVIGLTGSFTCTIFIPLAVKASNGAWVTLFLIKFISGLFEGVLYPASNVLLGKWVPACERSTIGGLVMGASHSGTVFGNLLAGALIYYTKSWAIPFFVLGAIGLTWVLCFVLLCSETPFKNFFISKKELEFLGKELGSVSRTKIGKTPWSKILSSASVWAFVVANCAHDWRFYTLMSYLPLYMKEVLKFGIKNNAIVTAVPYATLYVCIVLVGMLCDLLFRKCKCLGKTHIRKIFGGIGLVIPGIIGVGAVHVGCHQTPTVAMFTLSVALMAPVYSSIRINALDLCPNFSGTVMGLSNGLAALTGIFAPFACGLMINKHSLEQWRSVFWLALAILIVGAIIFVIFGKGEEQYWNFPNRTKEEFEASQLENKENKPSTS